ncbi:Tec1p [Sporobolomyces salmoneus]|uniref:Tec1p n=1 Tax=Sporobolomyces salmoneus TaxID=183962 RepID=UPI00316B74A2
MQGSFSSPPFDTTTSPSSSSMIRKRTFQDMQPGITSSPGYSSACDSSPSSLPFHDYHFLSSPETSISTLASSPMSRNASTQSCFSTFSPSQDYAVDSSPQTSLYAPFPTFSPTQQPFLSPDANDRPGMKRRKTMPEVHQFSPTTHAKPRDIVSPRSGGRDGEDVWPPAVEECFQTALRLLPRLGRKKLIIQGKPCGRNELIADYIFRHTGKMRSRKQVSSHIQVLKNLKKDDEEFMYLVSDPVEGEDQFLPGNADLFFGEQGMASRHAPPVFLERSLSASNVPHHPPIDLSSNLTVSGLAPPFLPPPSHPVSISNDGNTLHSPFVMHPSPSSATTPTSGITRAMQGMSVAVSPSPSLPPVSCPIAPSFMWVVAPTSSGDKGHIYARLEAPNGPTRSVYLEDLPMWEKRYSSIPAMNDHLPCQFLHIQLPLSIPGVNGSALDQPLETQLRVTAVQALPLTSITSIYCHGDLVITYEDTLNPLPLESGSNSLNHQNYYDVPFGSDFWTMLLRGGQDGFNEPTLRKSAKERQSLADMLPGFSVVQEFVVPSEHGSNNNTLSPGSAMGDVVLVVLYDLEVSKGMKAQMGDISFLSLRRSSTAASPPSSSLPPLPVPPFVPSTSTASYSQSVPTTTAPEVPQLVIPSDFYHDDSSSLDTARPPSHSLHKPNLSLHIPPPPRFTTNSNGGLTVHSTASSAQPSPSILSATGPITPWGQVVHTPTHPPPVLPPPSAIADAQRDRSRLEAAWRSNAAETNNRWDLDSPALYGPPLPLPSTSHAQDHYGFYDINHHPHQPSHHHPLHQSHLEEEHSNSSLSSFAMDRRSLSSPAFSTSSSSTINVSSSTTPASQLQPRSSSNLLPPLPSPSSLTANFNNSSNAYSPSPLSFPSNAIAQAHEIDYLNSKSLDPSNRSNVSRSDSNGIVNIKQEEDQSPRKKAVASKSEQDAFFSNLLGSTTRYTVTS